MESATAEPLRPPLLRRLRTGHWIALDCVAAALVLFVALGGAHTLLNGPAWVAVVGCLLGTAAIATRRLWSDRGLVAGALLLALVTTVTSFPMETAALGFVLYLAAQRLPLRTSLWLLGATLAITAAGLTGHFSLRPGHIVFFSPAPVLGQLGLPAGGWALGLLVGQQRRYAAAQRDRTEQRAAAELAEARRALSDERLRIARELHDVLAHSMSLIAVQAGVANHVAAENPDEVRRALTSIEDTSRGALRELRALLGVLRTPDGAAEAGDGTVSEPTPGLGDLEALLARTAEAGVHVDFQELGERPPADLPAGLQLALYRVAQEALTNVVKHAGADRCEIVLAFTPDTARLRITDAGPGAGRGAGPDASASAAAQDSARSWGSGHGIAGMRERVTMYGGSLHAGPLATGGFQVTARLPLTLPEVSS